MAIRRGATGAIEVATDGSGPPIACCYGDIASLVDVVGVAADCTVVAGRLHMAVVTGVGKLRCAVGARMDRVRP